MVASIQTGLTPNTNPRPVKWEHPNGTTISPTSTSKDGTVEMVHVPVASTKDHNGKIFRTLVELDNDTLVIEWIVQVVGEDSVLERDIGEVVEP